MSRNSSDEDDSYAAKTYHYSYYGIGEKKTVSNPWPNPYLSSSSSRPPTQSPPESSYHPRPRPPLKATFETLSYSKVHSANSFQNESQYDKGSKIRTSPRSHETLLTKKETQERVLYWRDQALAGGFHADVHIVDPVCHQSHLQHIEESVIMSSEFFRCRGLYRCDDNSLPDLSRNENWLPNMSDSLRFNPNFLPRGHSRKILESLWKSYIILCQTMLIFERLQWNGFCTTFYSMLAGQSGTNMAQAQLVRVNEKDLDGLKTGLKNAIIKIFNGDSEDGAQFVLLTHVATQCDLVFGQMTLLQRDTLADHDSIVTLCRMTVLLLDLAMVSYVGCHGGRFTSYVESESESIEIHSGNLDIPSFQCCLKPLACLSEFLDNTRVWVFQPIEEHSSSGRRKSHTRGMTILARMEEFSDVWGPVWPVRLSASDRIRQYNLSRGFIRPIPSGSGYSENGIKCHWYSSSSILQPAIDAIDATENELTMGMDDLLSIGGALYENDQCGYTRVHFERRYGRSMGFLGTLSPSWELDCRSIGFSAGHGFNLTANGTQKRLPGVTLKESIYNSFSQNPENANPEVFNLFIGVEISHCSGCSRRMRMRDLLQLESVRYRLDQKHHNWELTEWGELFVRALENEDPNAIHIFWRDHRDMREEIGKLLTPLLQVLHFTGRKGNTLVAAYLAEWEDRHLEIESRGNECGICLRDSVDMATYAVIGNKCLKASRARSRFCSRGVSETMYETGIEFDGDLPSVGDNIHLNPGGIVFQVSRIRGNRLTLVPRNIQAAARILHPRTVTALEIVGRIGSGRKFFSRLIKASTSSYGGMRRPRQAILPPVQNTQFREPPQTQAAPIAIPIPSRQPDQTLRDQDFGQGQPLPRVQQIQRRERRRKKKKKHAPETCCVIL